MKRQKLGPSDLLVRVRRRTFGALALLVLLASVVAASSGGPGSAVEAGQNHPGLELLLHEPLSMRAMTLAELGEIWRVWEPEARARAEAAEPELRRRLVYARYGLVERGLELAGDSESSSLPLGYAVAADGSMTPNCLACHGGRVAGKVIPGIANNEQDLAGLVGDLAALRALRSGSDPQAARAGWTGFFPLNFSRGTTNATMYSILLGSMRDENLDLTFPPRLSQELVHNSIDAPAWWHFAKKERIYWDGMAPKTVRTLMQFTMAPGLTGEQIRSWEDEFETIRSYLESLQPPPYPWEIDGALAADGRIAFERVCSRCHGTYATESGGNGSVYPNRSVPLAEIGTDPVRLDAIRPSSKEKYNRSWFSNYGEHPVRVDVDGYVAPPLDGVWATAPYLHNGSVPTLWHLLRPDERPAVWRRVDVEGYDRVRVGMVVESLETVPVELDERQRRDLYDTTLSSQSAAGHRFPELLSAAERLAVLEYLKSL